MSESLAQNMHVGGDSVVGGVREVAALYNDLYNDEWTEALETAGQIWPDEPEQDKIVKLGRILHVC